MKNSMDVFDFNEEDNEAELVAAKYSSKLEALEAADKYRFLQNVSGRAANEEEVLQALKEKNRVRAEKQKLRRLRKVDPGANSQMPDPQEQPPTHELDDTLSPQTHDLTKDGDSGSSPRPKRARTDRSGKSTPTLMDPVDVPDEMCMPASRVGLDFGRHLTETLHLSTEQVEMLRVGPVQAGKNAAAYHAQALLWDSVHLAESSRLDKEFQEQKTKFKKTSEDSKSLEQQLTQVAKEKKDLEARVTQLSNDLSTRGKELEAANKARLAAQVEWTEYGIRLKLQKAKDIGWDHTALLEDYEVDPFEPASEGEGNEGQENQGEN